MPDVVKMGRYLEAYKLPPVPRRKTDQWTIRSTTGSMLGTVDCDGRSDQYEFSAALMTSFNAECLAELARFVTEANDARRA